MKIVRNGSSISPAKVDETKGTKLTDNTITVKDALAAGIESRSAYGETNFGVISTENFDYATKMALTDINGLVYTADEQDEARNRLGIYLDMLQSKLYAGDNIKISTSNIISVPSDHVTIVRNSEGYIYVPIDHDTLIVRDNKLSASRKFYSGKGDPSSALGTEGDIYFRFKD